LEKETEGIRERKLSGQSRESPPRKERIEGREKERKAQRHRALEKKQRNRNIEKIQREVPHNEG